MAAVKRGEGVRVQCGKASPTPRKVIRNPKNEHPAAYEPVAAGPAHIRTVTG
jgi:hypothetical protein